MEPSCLLGRILRSSASSRSVVEVVRSDRVLSCKRRRVSDLWENTYLAQGQANVVAGYSRGLESIVKIEKV